MFSTLVLCVTAGLLILNKKAKFSKMSASTVRVKRDQLDKDGKPIITATFFEPSVKIDEPLQRELTQSKDEVENVVHTLRIGLRSRALDPTNLYDIVKYVGEDVFHKMYGEYSTRFMEKTREHLTRELVERILLTHFLIATYPGLSAKRFFEDDKLYPNYRYAHYEWNCSEGQYRGFMDAMDSPSPSGGQEFNPVGAVHHFTAMILEEIGISFARLLSAGFPEGLVIDDHQIPASSSKMQESGFRRKRNDKKAASFGVVMDLAATQTLRLPIALSMAQGSVTRWGALEKAIKKVVEAAHLRDLSGTLWLMDRDYGKAHDIILKMKGGILSTVKKGGNFNPRTPFTFGVSGKMRKSLRDWMEVIELEGAPTFQSCQVDDLWYLAYRPQPGKVVLMVTTEERFVDSWCYSTSRFYSAVRDGTVGDTDNTKDDDDDDESSSSSEIENDEDSDDASDIEKEEEFGEPEPTSVAGAGEVIAATRPSRLLIQRSQVKFDPKTPTTKPSEVLLTYMNSYKRPGNTILTLGQKTSNWFIGRVGACSSTGFASMIAQDAKEVVSSKILGEDVRHNVAGRIVMPRDILLGVRSCNTERRKEMYDDTLSAWMTSSDDAQAVCDLLVAWCKPHRTYFDKLHAMWGHRVLPAVGQRSYCGTLDDKGPVVLKKAAKAFSIDVAGVSNEDLPGVVSRGRDTYVQKKKGSIVLNLLSPWGLTKRISTDAMEGGSTAEKNARPVLPKFLNALGSAYAASTSQRNPFAFVSDIREEGLVESDRYPSAVTSIDGMFFAATETDPAPGLLKTYIWENKALFANDTLAEAQRLIREFGCFSEIEFRATDSIEDLQKKLAMFGARKKELLQVMHHCAVTGLEVIYTLVDGVSGRFLRAIRVAFCSAWQEAHLAAIQFVFGHHFPGTFDETASLDVPSNKARVNATDLRNLLSLRRILRSGPHPDVNAKFLPSCCRLWNRWKSAIDAQSKDAIGLRVDVGGTHRKIIMEALTLMLVGCVRLFRAQRIVGKLNQLKSRDEILRALNSCGATQDIVAEMLRQCNAYDAEPEQSAPGSLAAATRTPAPTNGHYRPADPRWEALAREQIKNVASTAAGKAQPFDGGILRQVRLNEKPSTWLMHCPKPLDKRRSCVLCCYHCNAYWESVADADIGTKTEEEHRLEMEAAHISTRGAGRQGASVAAMCSCCEVVLCTVSREKLWGEGTSCWRVWHSRKHLPLEHPISHKHRNTVVPPIATVTSASVASDARAASDSASKRRRGSSATKSYTGEPPIRKKERMTEKFDKAESDDDWSSEEDDQSSELEDS